jgi:hypothetical protein
MMMLTKHTLNMKAIRNDPKRAERPPTRAGPMMLPQLAEKVTIETAIPVLNPGSDPAVLIRVGYSIE